ncbi:MAG TPA: non-canonical purine NTP pyrophosphatase [Longimicrobiales bacterium]
MKAAQYVLATRSAHKAGEIIMLLGECGATIISLDDAGVPVSAAEDGIEVYETFRENAIAKARYFCNAAGMAAIADDSGIMLDALGGLPGVRSRRFSNRPDLDGTALDRANNDLAVERLRSATDRTAHYVCAAALALPDGHTFCAVGSCTGTFLLEPRGTGGFGYDPHFLVTQADRTFGEMEPAQKHRFSHRARAFRALAPLL